ncbi:unnamed protein product [Rhodiola kirilowii]
MKAFSPSSDRSVGVELYRSMAVLFSKLHELAQSRATNTTFGDENQGGFYLEPGQHELTLLN